MGRRERPSIGPLRQLRRASRRRPRPLRRWLAVPAPPPPRRQLGDLSVDARALGLGSLQLGLARGLGFSRRPRARRGRGDLRRAGLGLPPARAFTGLCRRPRGPPPPPPPYRALASAAARAARACSSAAAACAARAASASKAACRSASAFVAASAKASITEPKAASSSA